MKKKLKLLPLAALILLTGTVLLGAAQGSQTDPLVTVSYLTGVVTPKILSQVDANLTAREQALTDKFAATAAQYEADLDKALADGDKADTATAAFVVVTVPAGKKLTGGVGCEFLLRAGSATCVAASAPGLIDSTDGTTLPTGGALVQNHLYLSTAEGRGLKAASELTVMVRGAYSIG